MCQNIPLRPHPVCVSILGARRNHKCEGGGQVSRCILYYQREQRTAITIRTKYQMVKNPHHHGGGAPEVLLSAARACRPRSAKGHHIIRYNVI